MTNNSTIYKGKGVHVELIRASSVKPEPVLWYWRDWLAAGKLHVLGGAPGTGKTTIALDFAAVISSGGCWPDGSAASCGNVVIWSGEDDHKDTLIPRLLQAGANMDNIFFIAGVQEGQKKRSFDPAIDMEPLLRKLKEIGNVRLLIIDPIVSAVTGDSHKNAEVRRSLQPLVDLAGRLGCALLGITHFSKATHGRNPVERLTGSLAFGALARVVLVVAKLSKEDEEDEMTWLLMRAKSNIGPDEGGFVYQLQQNELANHPGVCGAFIKWKQFVEGSARDWLASAEKTNEGKRQGVLEKAIQFLSKLLANGPLPQTDIEEQYLNAGYSHSTIRRAKSTLQIQSVKAGGYFGGEEQQWLWLLPKTVTEDIG
ncbi:AAA family ATPase [Legionella tunisiensis]|uniref:AAA family ATPase n=1 Tax=Legionella tunisiensis TaxID=1034944 RepID=UPI0018DE736F|nr:AAA family ATPase [Legionella tunisiensis]